MSSPEDLSATVRRAQQLDPAALDTLVDAYSSRLYGFLYRLTGDRHTAEDLVQEVFVRVVRTIARYRDDGRFEAWIFRIASNLARDRVRRLRRRPETTTLGPVEGEDDAGRNPWDQIGDPSGQSPSEPLELAETVDRMQKALAELAEPEREVILLRHYTGLSFAEIAETMGTPLGTALARAHRGLRKLRALMEAEDDA